MKVIGFFVTYNYTNSFKVCNVHVCTCRFLTRLLMFLKETCGKYVYFIVYTNMYTCTCMFCMCIHELLGFVCVYMYIHV